MGVVIAGGHGKIGLRLGKLLSEGGHRVRGIVRNPDHAPDLEAAGIEPVVADMERETSLTACVEGAGAVVFAAGAGPGSGPERKQTVDLGAAVKLIEAAREAGASRYLIVSSIGAHEGGWAEFGGEQMRPYLEAKAAADEAVAASGLDFTIVRPGSLTDEPGTGEIQVHTNTTAHPPHRGPIPRDDVAATLAACLDEPATIGKTFELFSGDTPIAQALRGL